MVGEFEETSVLAKADPPQFRHHGNTPAFQTRFYNHRAAMCKELEHTEIPLMVHTAKTKCN